MCGGNQGISNGSSGGQGSTGSAGGGQAHSHNLSANFVGSATSVTNPYLILQYIIKT